jgi:Fe-Mn family superoxide dismutase
MSARPEDTNHVRILEEIAFWKEKEAEHTQLIRQIIPNLEKEYVDQLQAWETAFKENEKAAKELIEWTSHNLYACDPKIQSQVATLTKSSIEQSEEFNRQLAYMKAHSDAIKSMPQFIPTIKHIQSESCYVAHTLQSLFSPSQPTNLPLHSTITSSKTTSANSPTTSSGPTARLSSIGESPIQSSSATNSATASVSASKSTSTSTLSSTSSSFSSASPNSTSTSHSTWSSITASNPVDSIPIGQHTLPPLPYAYDALEPHIDRETMRIHHKYLHQKYVDGLNQAELKLQSARETGDFSLVKHWEKELAFHGAGHYLHSIFWQVMQPPGCAQPSGSIEQEINRSFGSVVRFKQHFTQAATQVEGGGWAILVWSPRVQRLEILQAEKHQNLSQWDIIPLLPLDVWEHAYFLTYKQNREAYSKAWWNVVNWEQVNDRLTQARSYKPSTMTNPTA